MNHRRRASIRKRSCTSWLLHQALVSQLSHSCFLQDLPYWGFAAQWDGGDKWAGDWRASLFKKHEPKRMLCLILAVGETLGPWVTKYHGQPLSCTWGICQTAGGTQGWVRLGRNWPGWINTTGPRCYPMGRNLQVFCSWIKRSNRLQEPTCNNITVWSSSNLLSSTLSWSRNKISFVCLSLSNDKLPVFLNTRHTLVLAFGPETWYLLVFTSPVITVLNLLSA